MREGFKRVLGRCGWGGRRSGIGNVGGTTVLGVADWVFCGPVLAFQGALNFFGFPLPGPPPSQYRSQSPEWVPPCGHERLPPKYHQFCVGLDFRPPARGSAETRGVREGRCRQFSAPPTFHTSQAPHADVPGPDRSAGFFRASPP